jgi:two-component system, OmpR family, response regulator BaeR
MSTRILIVEDEADLSGIVADYAQAAGYTTEVIADGRAALARIRSAPPALIVLDLVLPGMDGLALCRAVRAFSAVPIIMVTARVEELDRLLGFATGADDYLCKPFSPRELMARIKAVLARGKGATQSPARLQIDEATRCVRVQGAAVTLTLTEFNLFTAMAKRPGVIFSRAQLLDLARRDSLEVNDRAVDTHVKNLRRKLAAVAPELELIESVYGLGYRVEP